jgi:hypothetical protein
MARDHAGAWDTRDATLTVREELVVAVGVAVARRHPVRTDQ